MALDINFSDLIGSSTIADGGYVGDLMKLGLAHIAQEMDEQRLTQEQAGQVYVSLITTSFQTGLKFLMEEALVEKQVESADEDINIKRAKAEAELEKQWGYDVTRDANSAIVLGNANTNGQVDKTVAEITASTLRADSKQSDAEATSAKNRDLVDKQILLVQRQKEGFDDSKHHKNLASALSYLGIVRQDENEAEFIPRPPILSTSEGINSLFTKAIRPNTVVYSNDRPFAAHVGLSVEPLKHLLDGFVHIFNIRASADYSDIELDFTTFAFVGASTKVVGASTITYVYDSTSGVVTATVSGADALAVPSTVYYTIDDANGLTSLASGLSFIDTTPTP